MVSEELLNKMRQHYSEARQLAKEIWITMDNEGDKNDYYYFECGFVAGLNYSDSEKYKIQKKRLETLQKLSDLDQEMGLQ